MTPAGRAAVDALVAHGFWTEDGDSFVIVDYLEHAFPAEQIKRTRAKWSEDKARQRQHRVGDHALCKDDLGKGGVRFQLDSTKDSPGGLPRIDQTRPDQTRR